MTQSSPCNTRNEPHPTAAPIERQHVVIATQQRTCEQHGVYDAHLLELQPPSPITPAFWSHCPACNAEIQAEHNVRAGTERERRQRILAERLAEAGIPPRYRDCTVWNWQHGMDQQRRVWQWARDYCAVIHQSIEKGRSAALTGAPGTGKTHLAIGVLRHVLEKGGTGCYTTVMGLLSRVKDTYNRDAKETEKHAIARFVDVDLLVVDEVGRQLDTNYEHAQFFRVLDQRYGMCKPTILVGNLSREKLGAFLGDAVIDRLREGGGALLVFDWASQRHRQPRAEDQ